MTLKQYIIHQLGEIRREMIEAVRDLPAGILESHEPAGHWPIGWIVQHCCINADYYLHHHITGRMHLEHEDRFKGWPLKEPEPGDAYPSADELTRRWSGLWDAIILEVGKLDEASLNERLHAKEPIVESCLRVINHANSHLRSIWFILGQKRADAKFPEQQTWLA